MGLKGNGRTVYGDPRPKHPTSGVVLKLFQPAKSKIHQDWTIVCWHNEAGDWTQ